MFVQQGSLLRRVHDTLGIQVDLMIVLDTSGSVFNSFAQERQIAVDLVNAVDPSNSSDALRVGQQISFAAFAIV